MTKGRPLGRRSSGGGGDLVVSTVEMGILVAMVIGMLFVRRNVSYECPFKRMMYQMPLTYQEFRVKQLLRRVLEFNKDLFHWQFV